MRTIERVLTAGAVILGSFAVTPSALAGTISVTTTTDQFNTGTECSLREAVEAANTDADFGGCTGAAAGPDTITLPAGTYTLTIAPTPDGNADGDLLIESDITLDPTGAVRIDGGMIDRVFSVGSAGALTASDLTITRGVTPDEGAAILSGGSLTLTGVTLTGNQAGFGGGAISNGAGTVTLRNVTISGNQAGGDGGGLNNVAGTATLNNVTFTDNVADSDADGIGDGGGLRADAGTVTIHNTLLGGNQDKSTGADPNHPDCSGSVSSGGYNLIQDADGCTLGGTLTGNITGANPQLMGLADNGGPTPTHALRKGSPAVDAGNPASPGSSATACETTDQRGIPRPQGPRCDIGSFEREQPSEVTCLGRPVTMTGTSGNDVLTGTPKRDVIRALGGDDVIDALGGNDRVCAGAGNDRVNGRSGRDVVAGGAGNDRVRGAGGDDDLRGQGGRDRLKGKGGDDVLRGGPEPDNLNGGAGTDTCRGGGGRDRIRRCEG
ncbi:MAG: choice-of-anchor Q domain-containing protein [Actinomycetota bacterium]